MRKKKTRNTLSQPSGFTTMQGGQNGRKLIVVQLNGGNDGLNTIIPYRNDIYYRHRPTLGIRQKNVLDLNGENGLHPALKTLADLYHNGELTMINQVGYPDADRSHFRMMKHWHGAGDHTTGWLGRYLDSHPAETGQMKAVEVSDILSKVLKGEKEQGVAFDDLMEIWEDINSPGLDEVIRLGGHHAIDHNRHLQYIYQVLFSGHQMVKPAVNRFSSGPDTGDFPKTAIGKSLQQVAKMITSGIETEIYYVSHGSFDTHNGQAGRHTLLLKELAGGLGAFVRCMKQHGRFDEICMLIFSEFGRRVSENGNKGTDHGAGNSLFVISSHLSTPGFFNAYTDLTQLHRGDVTFEIDFRRVYAAILEDWLHANSTKILKNNFEKINLFRPSLAHA